LVNMSRHPATPSAGELEGCGLSRRLLLQAAALQVVAMSLSGCTRLVSPSKAKQLDMPVVNFSTLEIDCLEAAGEALVPDAAACGIIHFIDSQLSVQPGDSLLFIKYLDQPPPWLSFYQSTANSFDAASLHLFNRRLGALREDQSSELMRLARDEQIPGWTGSSSALAYAVLRSDAIDVVYGTAEGFAALDVPYLAHIEPVRAW
jgi:hypothetical protein